MRGAGAHTQANMAGTLLWLGRWDEADRARHAADEADAAVESAARLRELAHRTADDRGDACPPFVTAMLCAANAEWTRARGPSSAESWGVAADAWDQESFPYPAAYA